MLKILGFILILMLFQETLKGCAQSLSRYRGIEANEEKEQESDEYNREFDKTPLHTSTENHLRNIARKKDHERIENILTKADKVERMKAWNGIALFVEEKPDEDIVTYYYYNSVYRDFNNNGVQDEEDEGFFNPASTVKVSITALVLEKLNGLKLGKGTEYREFGSQEWYSIFSDLELALVMSSNEATNRLILFLGFDSIREGLQSKGLQDLSINRLMLDRGTQISSPPFEMRYNGSVTFQPYQEASSKANCFEAKSRIGNCATAVDLVGVMARIIQPDSFPKEANFNIRNEDLFWLREIMSKTPRELGFEQEDNFCRFLQPLYEKKASESGRMLSKCGIGLFSHSFVDTSYIQTNEGESYYIVFAVQPPRYISKENATEWMSEVSELILNEL